MLSSSACAFWAFVSPAAGCSVWEEEEAAEEEAAEDEEASTGADLSPSYAGSRSGSTVEALEKTEPVSSVETLVSGAFLGISRQSR